MQRRPPEATPLEAVAERVEEDLGALAGLHERLRQQRRVGPLGVVLEDQPLVRRRPTVRNEHERSDARPRRRETRDERRRAQGPQAEAEAREARGSGHYFFQRRQRVLLGRVSCFAQLPARVLVRLLLHFCNGVVRDDPRPVLEDVARDEESAGAEPEPLDGWRELLPHQGCHSWQWCCPDVRMHQSSAAVVERAPGVLAAVLSNSSNGVRMQCHACVCGLLALLVSYAASQ